MLSSQTITHLQALARQAELQPDELKWLRHELEAHRGFLLDTVEGILAAEDHVKVLGWLLDEEPVAFLKLVFSRRLLEPGEADDDEK